MTPLPSEPQSDPDEGAGVPSLVEPIDLAAAGRRRHPMRDILPPAERAELDGLLPQLPPSETAFVRIIEIFMSHELNQAATFNGEVRDLLRELNRRLANLEATSNPAVIAGMHEELAAQTEAISAIGSNLIRIASDVRGVLEHGARVGTELASHDRRLRALEGGNRPAVLELGPFGD